MFSFKKSSDTAVVSAGQSSAAAEPIVVVDVGCRWGFAERFLCEKCQSTFKIFGFDPDAAECARLQASYSHLPHGYVTCVPIGLAGSPGQRNLYVTKEPACSSLHPPIQYLAEKYPALDCIGLQEIHTVDVTTLDLWAYKNNLQAIDYIKIDTQGSELEILKGGDSLIKTIRCIDIEVEFNPIYEGQTLFGETDTYLRSKGFVLWRLSNLVHYSLGGQQLLMPDKNSVCFDTNVRLESEAYGGQLFWADARYIHKDVIAPRLQDSTRRQRDLLLFEALNMRDVVEHMNRVVSII
ncbi:FkbM family methyltransferase [Stutzerimonas zhaodongensis]|uniref:FkbM family methyltransferase n=1 Tax=Stutzerimonas zhaodongensis TaxID=1176257 RepID=A0A3M2HRC2_9GAMM|nr:FkbM family methyltransferase [Stutzerimonas zhaodongensis]MCQ4314775.1 FkbM family methyltransferase [Stutzerimonas zhaodongensis]RMH92276.1 FkbM family methyltransferase [Stutzerimonas zhaodongensis]